MGKGNAGESRQGVVGQVERDGMGKRIEKARGREARG